MTEEQCFSVILQQQSRKDASRTIVAVYHLSIVQLAPHQLALQLHFEVVMEILVLDGTAGDSIVCLVIRSRSITIKII